ncbi:MAG: helicase-associated domain-containing protein [Chitinispirillia bacterium]|nr:helicase-associated domain-containing protein [Chitinispirillia bacterium]MCL2268861.1 helicase-associated domain-containing protein [Chitinispirillia bacterium]
MAEHINAGGKTQFREYVGGLPHQWIFDNLMAEAGGERRILSSAMIKEAVTKFVARASLTVRFKGLPPGLRLRCAQVYLTGGAGLGMDDPVAYADDPLLPSLLVFAAQNGEGISGARLFGFDEFEPALRPLMAEALAEAGAGGECAPPAPVYLWRPLNDIAALCSMAAQGQLTRSVHGGLSRSALNTLKRLTHDPTLTGKSVSDGEPGHPAGFLIGFCLEEGLIADAVTEYRLNRHRFAAWSDKSMKERLNRLTTCALGFLGGFGLNLARDLLGRCEGRWLSVNSLVPESEWLALARAVCVMEFLGYVHSGHSHSSSGVRFAACKPVDGADDADRLFAKEPKRDTVVMSDFSVVIPQEVSPAELFEFSKIGVLLGFDKVYKGQITKDSISNALSAGIDSGEMRGWLGERRAAANVVKTVDEWIREFSRLYVNTGSALLTSDEKVTRQIASIEQLRKHLVEVSAHTVFRIRPGSEHKVLDILDKLGFDTREPGELSDISVRHEEKLPAVYTGLFTDREEWRPLTDFSLIPDTPPPVMRWTKYSAELKALGINEMIQVVDYALLTGNALTIDYDGSASIQQSIYTVVPLSIDKGIDAAVEAEIPCVRGRKQFYLNKIKRIGVVAK